MKLDAYQLGWGGGIICTNAMCCTCTLSLIFSYHVFLSTSQAASKVWSPWALIYNHDQSLYYHPAPHRISHIKPIGCYDVLNILHVRMEYRPSRGKPPHSEIGNIKSQRMPLCVIIKTNEAKAICCMYIIIEIYL